MKTKYISALLPVLAVLLTGCASGYQVSMVADGSPKVYSGKLVFDSKDLYTGTLSIPKGPNNESYTGRYTCVDKTATAFSGSSFGGAGGEGFMAGGSSSRAHTEVNATGHWIGVGSSGSTLTAEVPVGNSGHGFGVAKHSDGTTYKISF